MNRVIIFFVPTDPSRRDVEAALQQNFAGLQPDNASPKLDGRRVVTDSDQLPLWTWFVPNHGRYLF